MPAARLEASAPLYNDICPLSGTIEKGTILIKEMKFECNSFDIKDESFTAIWHTLF